jgi:glycerol-3-phosphate dehydrogenase (NAD(P)+)
MRVVVLGAGAWGTALAVTLSSRHEVMLWVRDPAQCEQMRTSRTNQRYLPGVSLPDSLQISNQASAACADAALAILGVTVAGLRATLREVAAIGRPLPTIWLCKGFEAGTSKLPHQVAAEELGNEVPRGALSGPSFAQEVARGIPAALTLAASDPAFAARTARELHSRRLRIYSSDDLTGVEVGAAVKNVIAIAAGISDGLGFGESARAALITRGLAEVTRVGTALGGRTETFMGLSGLGDLILTCTGSLSRNRQVGLRLAAGQPLPKILAELGHVAEGVHSAREVLNLARQVSAEMPIVSAVAEVLDGRLSPQAAVDRVLAREPKPEHPV